MKSTVDLNIGGMTCAACANRIERRLNRVEGVTATVNFATGTARVEHADPVTLADLVAAVEAVGYTASVGRSAVTPEVTPGARMAVSAALTVPVVLLAMLPGGPSREAWIEWALATPVVLWGGWPFHRAAVRAPGTVWPQWTHWSPWARWSRTAGGLARCSAARRDPTSRWPPRW